MQLVRTGEPPLHALLPPVATIGRSPDADLVLTSEHASGHHAEIRHVAGQWTVRDLSSRNGTWVDGELLHRRIVAPVEVGSMLRFGGADEEWRVTALHWPPEPALFDPATGQRRVAVDDTLGPLRYDLEQDAWLLDGRPVAAGARIGGSRLCLPTAEDIALTAPRASSLDESTLLLVPSVDLERVEVRLEGTPIVFEDRVWGIILYVLATDGDPVATDGWVDVHRLGRLTGLTRATLDIYVKRAREAFLTCGVSDGKRLVEARRNVRRLGTKRVRVLRA